MICEKKLKSISFVIINPSPVAVSGKMEENEKRIQLVENSFPATEAAFTVSSSALCLFKVSVNATFMMENYFPRASCPNR